MTDAPTKRGFTVTRYYDAPPSLVFDAWTRPEHLGWFFNPDMPHTEEPTVDLRVGGAWRQQMVINDHEQYITGGIYREIVPGQRLVFHWGAVGGWPDLDPDHLDDAPVVTIDLEPAGTGTRMVTRMQLGEHLPPERIKHWFDLGIEAGWTMTVDRLLPQQRRTAA